LTVEIFMPAGEQGHQDNALLRASIPSNAVTVKMVRNQPCPSSLGKTFAWHSGGHTKILLHCLSLGFPVVSALSMQTLRSFS